MDQIKLFTKDRHIITDHIINQDFTIIGSNQNYLTDSFTRKYKNDKGVLMDIGKFGTYITINPTTYELGSNIEQLSRQQLITFIENFEHDLNIDSNDFSVTGFDFNQNITTSFPPKNYLSIFRNLPHYDKTIYKDNEGVTFSNKCTSFTIYDKLKQSDIKYNDKYIMRLELGIQRKMEHNNNLTNIETLKDLTDVNNYNGIVDQWAKTYQRINKQSIYKVSNMVKPHNVKLKDWIIITYINDNGMENYLHQLQNENEKYHVYYYQRTKTLKLWNEYIKYVDDKKSDLLNEINDSVKSTAELCKQVG